MFAFFETNEELNKIIVIIGIVLIAIVLIALVWKVYTTVSKARKAKKQGENKLAEQPDVSADDVLEEMEQRDDYLVMARHVIYSVGDNGQILPGKYQLKCAIDDVADFNVRYNGLVREFNDGDIVYLAQGDSICPVSHSVLIRATK